MMTVAQNDVYEGVRNLLTSCSGVKKECDLLLVNETSDIVEEQAVELIVQVRV